LRRSFDDGTVDHVSYRDPETGLVVQQPVAATSEEQRETEIRGWQHALASVEHRLAALDPNDVRLGRSR
jgi:hypothetical protein